MTSLRELAQRITALADQLEEHKDRHGTNGIPADPAEWLQRLPQDLGQSRVELIDTLLELKYHVQSTEASFEDLFFGVSRIAPSFKI
jgi:hypothetical protein